MFIYMIDSVTKSVSDADRKRIAELEGIELSLRQEISKLKVISQQLTGTEFKAQSQYFITCPDNSHLEK